MRAMPIVGRRMLVVTAAALVLAVSAGAGAASADPVTGSAANGTYLALGDSVAFGYRSPASLPTPDYTDPHSFVGYPEFLAQQLDEHVANAGCPGETSTSMLVAGAPSFGCENQPGSPIGYRTLFPLHVQYEGTQMEYALHYLAAHQHTRLVTIDIGANDAFLCEATTADGCMSPGELLGVASRLAANLGTIFHDLRDVAGYQGPIVALTYYALSYTDPAAIAAAQFLNQVIAAVTTANGGIVADGFGAFAGPSLAAGGSACAAGLVIPLPGGGCDVHPTAAGAQLLAEAIAEAIGA